MKLTSQEYQRKQRNNLTVSPEERQVMRLFNGKRKIEEFFQKKMTAIGRDFEKVSQYRDLGSPDYQMKKK